ncbi:MAG: ATP-dependent DNA helicase RecG [Candidatus Pacebacteria bacterium]|nr:ATP-dependent DNA helicase RecG [Candidatus Paceibacterota bacterium]
MNFSTPAQELPRIGTIYQQRLKKLGIKTLGDLLFYFPERYEDLSRIKKIKDIKINEEACLIADVMEINQEKSWRKKMSITKAFVQDDSGIIQIVWFNQPYLSKSIRKGNKLLLNGKIAIGKEGAYLSSPSYEKINSEKELNLSDAVHLGRIVPIYAGTQGLSSRWLRYILKPLLSAFKNKIPETLPKKILDKHGLPGLEESLWQIHFPDSIESAESAKKRFLFEQLFFISLSTLQKKIKLLETKAPSFPANLPLIKKFLKGLPFQLTEAQKKAVWEILQDLEKNYPMNRLLQGDVGSGKTVVAAVAAINIIKAKGQTVIMAPTEILTKQHFQTIFNFFKDFNVNIGILTGKTDKFYSKKLKSDTIEVSRQKLLKMVSDGKIDILVGTQALIVPSRKKSAEKNKVKFKNLGMVVIDEQHRFGVKQRAVLAGALPGQPIPHFLSMTATPIPRSLALSIWGDLDISVINQMPKGRKKIITEIVEPDRRKKIYDFIRKEAKEGKQSFIICPRIEPKDPEEQKKSNWFEKIEMKTVKEEYEKLSKEIFPDLKMEMLHGKMAPKEKDLIMKNFKKKKFDILISTSVVEVGIDIPNATVIAIEGADRFGLAQLHQFRGRVGRGDFQSYCFLFSDSGAKKTNQRLNALAKYDDGFKLAEMDLKIRGPGDFFGVKQWGLPDYAMAALKDVELVSIAKESAKEIIKGDPSLKKYPIIKRRLEGFEENVHLE